MDRCRADRSYISNEKNNAHLLGGVNCMKHGFVKRNLIIGFSVLFFGVMFLSYQNFTAISAPPPVDGLVVNAVADESVIDAFNKAENLADNRARQLTLQESAVIFRQSFLPWTISMSVTGNPADAIVIHGLDFVFDTRTMASNKRTTLDLFRDSMSLYSYTGKNNSVYTNVWSRKENWFNSDSPTTVAGDDAVYASSTIYENMWQNKAGSAMVSGTVLKKKGRKIVCDSTNVCTPDGAVLSTKDVMAIWSQVNNTQTGVLAHFAIRSLTASQANDIVTSVRGKSTLTYYVNDENNQPIVEIKTNSTQLNFVPDIKNTSAFVLESGLGPNGVNLYTLHVWTNAKSATLPCVYQYYCNQN